MPLLEKFYRAYPPTLKRAPLTLGVLASAAYAGVVAMLFVLMAST